MFEAIEETLTGSLQAIASYGSIVMKEIWTALSTPENVPVFFSSLVKFSLGPTLAFVLSQKAFRYQEKKIRGSEEEKDKRKKQAVRLMVILEILHNKTSLEKTKNAFEETMTKVQGEEAGSILSLISFLRTFDAISILRYRFISMDPLLLSDSFSVTEIYALNDFYATIEGIKIGLLEIRRLDAEIRKKLGMTYSGTEHFENIYPIFQGGIDQGRKALEVLSKDEM